jgi:GT2 family glycosyltransferase
MPVFTIEVLVAAYQRPRHTRLCLRGLLNQTDRAFTVALADDGSGPEIGGLAEEFQGLGLDIRHVRHDDKGYGKAEILNKALASCKSDYVIFTDNDCVAQAGFIEDHRHVARQGCFVTGRRVHLGPEITSLLLAGKRDIDWVSNRGRLLYWSLAGKIRNPEFGLRLPWLLSDLWSRKRVGLLGANMAVWLSDLREVNGFDSEYRSYAGEDSDLEWRLLRHGVMMTSLLGRGAVFHLHHERRASNRESLVLLKRKMAAGRTKAVQGIEDLGPSDR